MRRATALLAAMLVAACAPERPAAEFQKSIRVEVLHFRHAVGAAGPAEEARRLGAFLDRLGAGYGDRIAIDVRDPALAAALARTVRQRGLAPEMNGAGLTQVSVTRHVATPPACPNWTSSFDGDQTTRPGSNYGCANAANLAAMVADPADLLRGRATPAGEAEGAVLAVQRYRTDRVRPLPELDTRTQEAAGGAAP